MSASSGPKLDTEPEATGPASPEIVDAEAQARRLAGATRIIASILTIGLAVYALYWVNVIVETQIYRTSFLLIALAATFLMYPAVRRQTRVTVLDWALIAATLVALGWPIIDLQRFIYRAAEPTMLDQALGVVTILLILEATRRTVGWILPVTAFVFLVYAYYGPLLDNIGLSLIGHRGYGVDRLVGALYMTLEGVFGIPLDVAATYIVLFTIYGAVLQYSGGGKFFLDWSMAAFGRSGRAGPGRTVTAAGALLGTISGSGVANTVMLGSVAWPMLRRAGYPPEVGGAMLSAAGIGAILSPPALGAAAFLIAEFLKISYLQVIVMAAAPAALYYLSILLMIEADARRLGTRAAAIEASASLKQLTLRHGYHFISPIAMVVFMVNGVTPFRAVFWAMLISAALSFIRTETALWPRRALQALETGGAGVLSVVATTAAAGIIVGVVTLTGLGLKVAGVIVTFAGGSLVLTVIYAAIAVCLLGLAVPVTASYIIAAVMIAPALTQIGVPPTAAHMFIFYYAVLSEVSPPTALSPFAAAALTGANPFQTMMLTWKYTLPAFLVPFVFTLTPDGMGMLLQAPWTTTLITSITAAAGIAAMAFGMGGWIRKRANGLERILMVVGGLMLVYARAEADIAGGVVVAAGMGMHLWRARQAN
jgi:TRAP transporter 4TM/12TM fusion protein